MRSESEIRWVRAKNTVGQILKASDWHVIIPGVGDINLPPGTACSTGLSGSLQFAQHSAMKTMDGRVHEECRSLARDWLEGVTSSPGPLSEPAEDQELAAPDTAFTKMPPRTV